MNIFSTVRNILIYLFAILFCSPSLLAEKPDEMCVIAKSAIVEASKIRGLRQKKKVPCYVRDKEQVKKYLLNTIEEKMPADKLNNEGDLYQALGFLPQGFDYKNGIIELYVSQLGGYYDPEDDYFVMAGWMPAMLQTTIAVHELTHALQDQAFDLSGLIDPLSGTSDQLMARSALVEGDATAVMFDFANGQAGQPTIAERDNVDAIIMQNVAGAAFMTGLQGAPSSLQYMLLFPYTSGLRFAHKLLQKGGYRQIDKAFKDMPKSTEEILHPDKYFANQKDFSVLTDEELITEGGGKLEYRDTFGEFSVSALLSTFTKDHLRAAKAAEGWGGDAAAILKDEKGNRIILWDTRWDTPKDAKEFFESYADALKIHYKDWQHSLINTNKHQFKDSKTGAQAALRLEGKRVVLKINNNG